MRGHTTTISRTYLTINSDDNAYTVYHMQRRWRLSGTTNYHIEPNYTQTIWHRTGPCWTIWDRIGLETNLEIARLMVPLDNR